MRIAFVTRYATHYRVKTYETLAKYENVSYFFHPGSDEQYRSLAGEARRENCSYEYLPSLRIGQAKILYTLPWTLWRSKYDLYLKCINNKFALLVTYLIARLRGKPFVLWTGIWKRLQAPMHQLSWPLTKYIFLHADAIVVYGVHVKWYLIEEGVSAEKIFTAPHTVNNAEYNQVVPEEVVQDLRHSLDLTPGQKVVLFVGRLVKTKGLSYLLEAFASIDVPEAALVLVGQGPEEAALRQQAKDLNIADRVRFVGYIPPDETVPYYAMAYVHVLPSVVTASAIETWGLVTNEAFNQGVPSIVTTGVGAEAGGLVEDGVTGLVVPERDSALLAIRLQHILCDDDLRRRLSVVARERVAYWNNEAMVAGFRAAIRYASE
jgi:glycosyltransferase involved in cell wall biosynthesis